MLFTTRFWGCAAVLLCALFFQNCQSNSLSATEEEELAESPSASAVHQRALSEPLIVQSLAFFKEDVSTTPSARVLIPSVLSTLASANNSSALPYNLLATERLDSHALYNTPGDAFSSVFTASSGERVRFRQHDGQWRAVLAPGTSLNEQEHTLPVVSSGNIESLLSSLLGQDVVVSRSLIHVLATPTEPCSSSTCVYVGRVGLLGRAPAQQAQEPAEEWLQGPTMIIGSDATSKETYHIPPGYRYKGYQLKTGSVIQCASLTINYIAAENEEEYLRLEAAQDAHVAAARLGVNVSQVVTLGEIKSNISHAAFSDYKDHDLKRTKYTGLVLYGITKKDKVLPLECPEDKSMINIQVEILVEKVEEASPVNFHGSYATGGINHGDTKPPAQDAFSSQVSNFISLESELKEEYKKAAERQKQETEALHKKKEESLSKEKERKQEALSKQAYSRWEQSRLSTEMVYRDAAHDDQAKKIREEYSVMFRKQGEEFGLHKILSEEYGAQLKFQQEVTAERVRQLLPSMAFGAQAWNKYYGEVGDEPALPADILAILNSRCPFWSKGILSKKLIRGTYLLVLIPAKVDGRPFTLNLLEELIKAPKEGGNETCYRHYDSGVKAQLGNNTPTISYWVLLMRDVLPESRSRKYAAQKELVSVYASRTGLNYEIPKALEVATAILMHYVRNGERLYGDNPYTYTRCQELVDFQYEGEQYRGPAVVGGFEPSGLDVSRDNYEDCRSYICGVAGCRKFF